MLFEVKHFIAVDTGERESPSVNEILELSSKV